MAPCGRVLEEVQNVSKAVHCAPVIDVGRQTTIPCLLLTLRTLSPHTDAGVDGKQGPSPTSCRGSPWAHQWFGAR